MAPRSRCTLPRVRSHLALCAVACLVAAPVLARQRVSAEQPIVLFGASLSPLVITAVLTPADADHALAPVLPAQASDDASRSAARAGGLGRRPTGLTPLLASYAALQVLDVHSTLRAFDAGAFEANPVMAGLADHPAAFIGFKAAVTIGGIVIAERLSRHSRVAAYVLMFALNSAYLYVVTHNYRLVRQLD